MNAEEAIVVLHFIEDSPGLTVEYIPVNALAVDNIRVAFNNIVTLAFSIFRHRHSSMSVRPAFFENMRTIAFIGRC